MPLEEAHGKPGSKSPLRWALSVLVLATLYFLVGLASNRLVSTGYVTMLWPSAGIRLRGILLLGWRAFPGLILGQRCVTFVLFPVETPWAVPLAFAVAIGPAIQAVVGAALLRRYTAFPKPFEDTRGVLLFLLLEFSPGSVATKVLGPYSSEEQRTLLLAAHGYFEPLWYRYFSCLG